MACELPVDSGVPLSRWSSSELAREAITRGIVEQISGVTVWRWLSEDAIKPWQHRSWIFPRDRRAKIFDRCACKDGIEPFDQLSTSSCPNTPTDAHNASSW